MRRSREELLQEEDGGAEQRGCFWPEGLILVRLQMWTNPERSSPVLGASGLIGNRWKVRPAVEDRWGSWPGRLEGQVGSSAFMGTCPKVTKEASL